MKLSARGRRLLEALQHGSLCSQEMMSMKDELNAPLFGSWPPNAATDLDKWLRFQRTEGVLLRAMGCGEHSNCKRYTFVPAHRPQPLPLFGDVPAHAPGR